MTIAVDLDVLRQHRLTLLAEADEIQRRACLDPPDVGELTGVTADALDRWLAFAHASDGEVGLGLDLLTSGVLAL